VGAGIAMAGILATLKKLTAEELAAIDQIGPVVADSLVEWMHDEDNEELLKKFAHAGVIAVQPEGSHAPQIFAGKTFVLTGTLPSLSREQAKTLIKERGGKVSSSVSAKTDYLLAGAEPGSKWDDARKMDVKTIDEKEFLSLLKR